METLTRDQLTFRILRSKLSKAQELASRLGIEIEVNELDPVALACTLFELQEHHIAPPFDRLDESYKAWARQLAADHLEIVARAPESEWSVIALADRTDGAPMFHALDPSVPYWTPETMDGVDFSRCDECGVRNRRNRAFIVRKGDEIRQIGGSCAKHLDLTKKIRDLLEGFQSFCSALREDEEWGGGFGSGKPLVNLPLAMMLAEELIAFEGYVSKKAADATFRMSTSNSVMQMLIVPRGHESTYRDNDIWRRGKARWLAGEGDAVLAEVQAWLDSQPDDVFHRNIRTSIQNQSWQLGLICFAVAEIRNWRLAIKAKEKGIAPKCYEHETLEPAAVAEACGLTLAELGELIGHDCSGKIKAPARKAIAKVLPGLWTITARASWESVYGWQDMIQLQRDDGARVKWMTGALDGNITWQKGEQYRILSASLGEDLGTHAKYGVQGRKISRAVIRPVKPELMHKDVECRQEEDSE